MYGDPRILTFDRWSQDKRIDFLEEGTHWVKKIPRISIQAFFEHIPFSDDLGRGWMTALIVSGQFLHGHALSFKAGPLGRYRCFGMNAASSILMLSSRLGQM